MTKKQLLFSFKGRINRKRFWIGILLNFLLAAVPLIGFSIFGAAEIVIAIAEQEKQVPPSWAVMIHSDLARAISTIIILPFLVMTIWASFAIAAKRFHDLNLSGWFASYSLVLNILIVFIPSIETLVIILMLVIFLALGIKKGTSGSNKYGSDPLSSK